MLDNAAVRQAVGRAAEPVARGLLRIGLSANHVTVVTALLTSAISLLTWSRGEFGLGLLIGFPFVIGDTLDGTMARLAGTSSKFGGFLDSVMDRITDAAIVGSLAYYYASRGDLTTTAVALIALSMGAVVPYARAKAESIGVPCKVGIMERSDRILLLAVAGLLAAFSVDWAPVAALYLLAVLTTVTVGQRIHAVSQALRHESD